MGFLLLLPFFFIRFGLLSMLDRGAVTRAAYFAPLRKQEKPAYWVYQLSNVAIFLCTLFSRVKVTPLPLFCAGITLYCVGTILLVVSVINFAAPSQSGINRNGLYRLSRNPMYVAYFILFLGYAALTQSLLLLGFVLAFQLSAHWIIRSEERWCIERFGGEYLRYMKTVRRYF